MPGCLENRQRRGQRGGQLSEADASAAFPAPDAGLSNDRHSPCPCCDAHAVCCFWMQIEFPDSSAAADKGGFPAAVADVVPVVTGSKPGASTTSSSTSGSSATTGSCCKPVMVPFACHVNHSPWPHCVRYGRLNPTTRTLDFPAFRPCTKGQQASQGRWQHVVLPLLCGVAFAILLTTLLTTLLTVNSIAPASC